MKITTDKSVYSYGEPIKVRMTVTNNTDSAFSVFGSSSCISRIMVNDKRFTRDCTLDDSEFRFAHGESWVWIWSINPEEDGLPDQDSIQVIYGGVSRWSDSTINKSPEILWRASGSITKCKIYHAGTSKPKRYI
ncbi:MAG: hypothetical protein Q8933_14090 [Bacteroidota bacterium]|nr:hypothetical protein [Bacteroidota bacterium]